MLSSIRKRGIEATPKSKVHTPQKLKAKESWPAQYLAILLSVFFEVFILLNFLKGFFTVVV